MKFLKYFCAASLLAASAGTLWSCDDDDDKRLSDAVLASVSSLTFEAQDTSEKIITVYADADWVTEIPDWVTVTPTEGTGVMDVTVSVSENMRDGAMDNPRKAKLVFKGRTLASRAEVLVSQVGNKFRDIPEYQKIGDVIALDDEAAVKIPSALVMAVTNKGFIISDDQQSGAIFVDVLDEGVAHDAEGALMLGIGRDAGRAAAVRHPAADTREHRHLLYYYGSKLIDAKAGKV